MKKILLGIIAILFATPSFAVDSDPCRNLFNKNAQNTNNGFVISYYLHSETGALTQFGSTRISEYIKVDSNTDYYLTSRAAVDTGSAGVCWYDNNKTQISCTSASTGRKTSPDNAKYIRISYWPADEDILQFERGTTATEYVPYNPNCIEFEYTSATGTVSQNGTPTPDNPIDPVFYQQGNMILRAVGDYADSYDATTGKITRRIGVKVFNGTEALTMFNSNAYIKSDASDVAFVLPTSSESNDGGGISNRLQFARYSAVIWSNRGYPNYWTLNNRNQLHMNFANEVLGITDYTQETQSSVIAKAQAYLKSQYDAGTPYVFYYALKTPVQEDWTETSYRSLSIKIATTKYNETAFGPLNTALANAISVVDSVVSNTITQAGRIATLQTQKQTRPNDIADDNEKCPAGKKCLLVEDASGVPHWYEIVENAWDLPVGYTQLQWIESTGTQWIDNIIKTNQNYSFEIKYKHTVSTGYQTLFAVYDGGNGYSYGFMEGSADGGNYAYSGNSKTFTLAYDNSTIYTLYYDGINKKVYRNGTEIVDFSSTTGFSGTTGVAPRLFNMINGEHHSNSFNYPFKGYAYGFKVYDDNNNLVRNLIPAKNASGVVGMYDLVGGRFYTNAGTGEFIAGPVAE